MSFKTSTSLVVLALSIAAFVAVAIDEKNLVRKILGMNGRDLADKVEDAVNGGKQANRKSAAALDTRPVPTGAGLSSYCVRPAVGAHACANDGDGSSWSCAGSPGGRGSFRGVPSSRMKRGAVYYVSDGFYPGDYGKYDQIVLKTPESGSETITIKKANRGDHGTNDGWDDSLGRTRALFKGFRVVTGHWIIDGQKRGGDWRSDYGFVIDTSEKRSPGICVHNTDNPSHVTVRHVEIIGGGDEGNVLEYENNLFYVGGRPGMTDWKIQYCYLHDAGGTPLQIIHVDRALIEYCLVARNESQAKQHSEGIMAHDKNNSWVVRFNIWEDIEGTAVIAFVGDYWEIYGNIFYDTEPKSPKVRRRTGVSNGAIATFTGYACNYTKIYNNTFANMRGNDGIYFSSGHGNAAFNNLWYNCGSVNFTNVIHDYNWFYGSGNQTELHIQVGNKDPFVNQAHHDFHLSGPTSPGDGSLEAPYNSDIDGKTRGADGVWDRGAFEYRSRK